MQWSTQDRRAFFAAFGSVKAWRRMRDTLARPERVKPTKSAIAARITRALEGRLDALSVRWQHETRAYADIAAPIAARMDEECARLPDRLRRAYVEAWLQAATFSGGMMMARAIACRMVGSTLGFDGEDLRLTSRARRVAFETIRAMVEQGQAHAYRGRGRAIADGHSTQGAVVYTKVREVRSREIEVETSQWVTVPLRCGTVAQAKAHQARRQAETMRLRRAATKSQGETTQGPRVSVTVNLPEVTPSTGDGARA
jgi:hypothetical protein